MQSVDAILTNASYLHAKVPQWQSMIVESILKRLATLNKPFKFVGESIESRAV